MGFSALGAKIWPVTPDWRGGVSEQLAWLTDVLQASATGVTQHRGLRIAPRRSFSFEVVAGGRERRVAEMLLAGHSGAWSLPIWPDVQWLSAPLAAGVDEIPCATDGYDFVADGLALLYSAVNRFELVKIASIEADRLALTAPTEGACAVGARLYPVRQAQVRDGAEERLRSADVGRRSLSFELLEACDWPQLLDAPLYLAHPVFDVQPDQTQPPGASVTRLARTVDYGTSMPVVHDLAGLALRAQQGLHKLMGRLAQARFRRWLYLLCGRRVPVWVPSWSADLVPAAAIAASSATLRVDWCGYALFGVGRPNRRDVRIELDDGTVHYRRITAAAQAGETETLTLNAALSGSAIAAERIRQISFMALCTLASDEVELEHQTDADGLAVCTLGWQAVVPNV